MEATPSFWIGCQDDVGDGTVVIDSHQAWVYANAAWCSGVWGQCGKTIDVLDDSSCVSDRPVPGLGWSRNGGVPWTTAAADEADWVYPGNTASAEFCGLVIHKLDVGRPAPLRDVSPVVTGGGVPGRLNRPFRTIRVEGKAFARTRNGLIFGLDWLERTFAAAEGTGTFLGCRLACPAAPTPNGRVVFADVTMTGFTVPDGQSDVCCDFVRDVEVMFTVASPWAFHYPPAERLRLFGGDTIAGIAEIGVFTP